MKKEEIVLLPEQIRETRKEMMLSEGRRKAVLRERLDRKVEAGIRHLRMPGAAATPFGRRLARAIARVRGYPPPKAEG